MTNFDAAVAKAEALCYLPVGWDYGSDGPASLLAFVNARAVLNLINNRAISDTILDVTPGRAAAITVFAQNNAREVEIHCRPTGAFDTVFYDDGDCYDYSLGQVEENLRGRGWLKDTLSISCTQNAIYLVRGDTPARRFQTQATAPEYRSSAATVSTQVRTPSVIIYDSSLMPA